MPYTRSDIQKLVAHPVAHITDTYVAIETQYIFTLFYEQYEMFNSQKKKKCEKGLFLPLSSEPIN